VSNPGLIFYLENAQGTIEFLEEVIFFVVPGGAAEVSYAEGPIDRFPTFGGNLPGFFARFFDPPRDHFHSLRERDHFPLGRVGFAVENLLNPVFASDELEGGGTFWTKTTLRNRRIGIAFYIDDTLVFHVYELSAADRAIRANGADNTIGSQGAGGERTGTISRSNFPQSMRISLRDLFEHGPIGEFR
jgi:hypothetical protein